jgi:hypothetical protein
MRPILQSSLHVGIVRAIRAPRISVASRRSTSWIAFEQPSPLIYRRQPPDSSKRKLLTQEKPDRTQALHLKATAQLSKSSNQSPPQILHSRIAPTRSPKRPFSTSSRQLGLHQYPWLEEHVPSLKVCIPEEPMSWDLNAPTFWDEPDPDMVLGARAGMVLCPPATTPAQRFETLVAELDIIQDRLRALEDGLQGMDEKTSLQGQATS